MIDIRIVAVVLVLLAVLLFLATSALLARTKKLQSDLDKLSKSHAATMNLALVTATQFEKLIRIVVAVSHPETQPKPVHPGTSTIQ